MVGEVNVRIYNIEWVKRGVDECNWYCDDCHALLNDQPDFYFQSKFKCQECGYENDITEDNIVETRPDSLNATIYNVSSKQDLEEKIRDYLESEYRGSVEYFDYDADEEIEYESDPYDDDYELAKFCRGED